MADNSQEIYNDEFDTNFKDINDCSQMTSDRKPMDPIRFKSKKPVLPEKKFAIK
jgi:hypothetical protein